MVGKLIDPTDFFSLGKKGGRRYQSKSDPTKTISQREFRQAKAGGLSVEGQIEQNRMLGKPDAKALNKTAAKNYQELEFKKRIDRLKSEGESTKGQKPLTLTQVRNDPTFKGKYKDLKRVNKGKSRVLKSSAQKRLAAYRDLDLITEEEYEMYQGDF